MDYRNLHISGSLRIAADSSLAETAAKLGTALDVTFRDDPCGKFDEFPSFSAESAGLSFALLGIPELDEQISPEPIIDYEFHIRMEFLARSETEDKIERCDASSYFAAMIRERSDLTINEE